VWLLGLQFAIEVPILRFREDERINELKIARGCIPHHFLKPSSLILGNRHPVLLCTDVHIHRQAMDCDLWNLGFTCALAQAHKAQGFELA